MTGAAILCVTQAHAVGPEEKALAAAFAARSAEEPASTTPFNTQENTSALRTSITDACFQVLHAKEEVNVYAVCLLFDKLGTPIPEEQVKLWTRFSGGVRRIGRDLVEHLVKEYLAPSEKSLADIIALKSDASFVIASDIALHREMGKTGNPVSQLKEAIAAHLRAASEQSMAIWSPQDPEELSQFLLLAELARTFGAEKEIKAALLP